jgi:hypothetical protein
MVFCKASVKVLGRRRGEKNLFWLSGLPVKSRLDFSANADIMSDMKTFTVRQLDREPGAVLDAADSDGAVRVKRRDGRSYSIQPEARSARIKELPDFLGRIKRIFPKPVSKSQAQEFDKLIAGE